MLLNVQMLRAIAAFLVVFVHLERLTAMAGFPAGSTFFGHSGVDLFFVISGMIMVMTTAGGRQTAGSFLRNRFTRQHSLQQRYHLRRKRHRAQTVVAECLGCDRNPGLCDAQHRICISADFILRVRVGAQRQEVEQVVQVRLPIPLRISIQR